MSQKQGAGELPGGSGMSNDTDSQPAPTLPPIGPDQNFLVGRVQESVMMVLVLIAFTLVAIKVFGPLARAWARKLEGRVGDPDSGPRWTI